MTLLSPDGKWWWDSEQWRPVETPTTTRGGLTRRDWRTVALYGVLGIVVLGLISVAFAALSTVGASYYGVTATIAQHSSESGASFCHSEPFYVVSTTDGQRFAVTASIAQADALQDGSTYRFEIHQPGWAQRSLWGCFPEITAASAP
jgi:hypothetical protein